MNQGHQLTQDLNYVVCIGKQWRIPIIWAPTLQYFAAPVLSIIFAFAYPNFYLVRGDPLQIFGFFTAHLVLFIIFLTFIYPRAMDVFIPKTRRAEGVRQYDPQTVLGVNDPNLVRGMAGDMETGDVPRTSSEEKVVSQQDPKT